MDCIKLCDPSFTRVIPERLGDIIHGNALYKSTVTLLTLRRFYDSAHRSLLLFRTVSPEKKEASNSRGGARAP